MDIFKFSLQSVSERPIYCVKQVYRLDPDIPAGFLLPSNLSGDDRMVQIDLTHALIKEWESSCFDEPVCMFHIRTSKEHSRGWKKMW